MYNLGAGWEKWLFIARFGAARAEFAPFLARPSVLAAAWAGLEEYPRQKRAVANV